MFNYDLHVENGKYVDQGDMENKGAYYESIFDLDRTDVIIVSDGFCASSCATFLLDAHESRAARVVAVGGLVTAEEEHIPSTCMAAGGSVQDIHLSKGGTVGLIVAKAYRKTNMDLTQEFSMGPHDFYLKHYSTIGMPYRTEYPGLLHKLTALMNDHDSYPEREKTLDIKRNPKKKCTSDETGVYGRRWDSKSRSYTGECTFLYCGPGYYEDLTTNTHKCIPIPSLRGKYESEQEKYRTALELSSTYRKEYEEMRDKFETSELKAEECQDLYERTSDLCLDTTAKYEQVQRSYEALDKKCKESDAYCFESKTNYTNIVDKYDSTRRLAVVGFVLMSVFADATIVLCVLLLVQKNRYVRLKKEHVPVDAGEGTTAIN